MCLVAPNKSVLAPKQSKDKKNSTVVSDCKNVSPCSTKVGAFLKWGIFEHSFKFSKLLNNMENSI